MIDPLKIHALADGEVPPSELAALRDEVSACEESSRELQAIKDLKALMSRATPVECEDTWKACTKRLNEIDKTRRVENTVGRYAWGLCGAFFVAIVFGGYMSRTGSNGVVRSGDVPRMVSGLIPFSSFKSKTPQDARQWMSANAADVSMPSNRIRILGGEIGQSNDGHKLLRLKLQDNRGDMDLIVIFGADQVDGLKQVDGQFQQGVIDELKCVAWHSKGQAMILVGDRSADELQAIASGSAG